MYKPESQKFICLIREALQSPWDQPQSVPYIQLDQIPEVSAEILARDQELIPQADPLSDACQMVLRQARNYSYTNTVFGINEIYKAYLQKLTVENQKQLTEKLTLHLEFIFPYVTGDEFPYTEKVWEWISASAKPVSSFLVKNNFRQAAFVFLEFIAVLGKQAARKNLSTGTLQHVFRILELKAEDYNWDELKLKIKNLRQNLES